jgi:hypothetical protein
MTVYGITRVSTRKQQASPEVQAEMIRKHCAALQLPEPVSRVAGRRAFPAMLGPYLVSSLPNSHFLTCSVTATSRASSILSR